MDLVESIRARIRSDGPLTFAEYMEMALYDPERGFFSGSPVGSHFVTSPHVSLVFASLLASQFAELLEPDDVLIDLGAGDGTLLSSLRRVLGARCIAVEQGRAARAAAEARGLEVAASIADLEAFKGVAVANELFDNVPFHRLRPGPVEVMVALDGDRLVELEGPPTIAVVNSYASEWTASPAAEALIAAVARRLRRGYVFIFDYGYLPGEVPEPVRGYRDHRLEREVLSDPGSMDITGPVDLEALAGAARAGGLEVFGPIDQSVALRNLGFAGVMERLRTAQLEHEAAGRTRQALGSYSARNEAAMLVQPEGLGSHRLLVLASPGQPAPRALTG